MSTTLDLQVEANEDDDDVIRETGAWNNTDGGIAFGNPGAGGIGERGIGLRFLGVNIPAGAIITAAFLTISPNGNAADDTVNATIACENSSNPAQMVSFADHIGRARTADVAWNAVPHWTNDVDVVSPSIIAAVQQVVDDNGGTGDAMIVFVEDRTNASTLGTFRAATAHNAAPTEATKIHIEFDEAVPAAPGGIAAKMMGAGALG